MMSDYENEMIEAASAAMWNDSDPVKKRARPTWAEVAADADWKHGVERTRRDAKVALRAAGELVKLKMKMEQRR